MERTVSRAYRKLSKTYRVRDIVHRCLRCDHTWRAQTPARPVKCPRCLTEAWDQMKVRWGRPEPYRHAIR